MTRLIKTLVLACIPYILNYTVTAEEPQKSLKLPKEEAISVVDSTNSSIQSVENAIEQLKRFWIPQKFWKKIANSTSYSLAHRRSCIIEFFRRYAPPEPTLAELRAFVRDAAWLKDAHISEVGAVTGLLPLYYNALEDSLFVILVLPEDRRRDCAIFVRIRGRIDESTFISQISGPESIWSVEKLQVGGIALVRNGVTIAR